MKSKILLYAAMVAVASSASALTLDEANGKAQVAVAQFLAAMPYSVYTDLARSCEAIKPKPGEEERDASRQICDGVSGYRLIAEYGDGRESVTVVSPDTKESPQDYWSNISSAFSTLGDKAEWRMRNVNGKAAPYALIVRHIAGGPEGSASGVNRMSRLVVSKITSTQICVTDSIEPGPHQNERAREAADVSVSKECLRRAP